MRQLDLKEVEQKLVQKIRSFVGTKNVFIDISGDVDSAVVAFLCVKALSKKRVFGVIMPYGRQLDINDAIVVAKQLSIQFFQKDIKSIVDQYKISPNRFVMDNLVQRTKMAILYAYTNHKNGLVAGTINKSQAAIGYFTKFGDSGCDFEPIADLYKTEIFELAKLLNVPKNIIDKKPIAGIWLNQSDEEEFGFTYKQLDRYLQGVHTDPEAEIKIQELINKSTHKRKLPPIISVE